MGRMNDLVSRQFEGIIVEYPETTNKEHIGKPYYSIKYIENGKDKIIGFGTYKIEVLSRYIRDYFVPSADLSDYCDKLWKLAYERGNAEGRPRNGKWIDYSDEGYVECPFCHSATNCSGNKDELHYCFSCGAELR